MAERWHFDSGYQCGRVCSTNWPFHRSIKILKISQSKRLSRRIWLHQLKQLFYHSSSIDTSFQIKTFLFALTIHKWKWTLQSILGQNSSAKISDWKRSKLRFSMNFLQSHGHSVASRSAFSLIKLLHFLDVLFLHFTVKSFDSKLFNSRWKARANFSVSNFIKTTLPL